MPRYMWALVVLVSLLVQPAAWAHPATEDAPRAQKGPSTAKRVVWTLIGAGIGFGAGLMLGLQQFDDAIDSDRKVWTSALVGAGAGGVAGALISGRGGSSNPTAGPATPLSAAPPDSRIALPPLDGGRRSVDRRLVSKVRDYNRTWAADRPESAHRQDLRQSADRQDPGQPTDRQDPRQSADRQDLPGSADSLRNGMIAGAIVGGIVGLVIVPATECKPSNPECPGLLRIGVGIPAVAGGAAIGALVDKLFED